MGQLKLYAVGLVVALAALGAVVVGQPPAWAPNNTEQVRTGPVIASTKNPVPNSVPSEARIPAPDDGLPLAPVPVAPSKPALPAPGPPSPPQPELQLTNFAPAPIDQPAAKEGPKYGAVLGVEVQGLAEASPGQLYTATLLVRNHGLEVLAQTRVELPIPTGVRVVNCDPPADRPGDRLSWLVGNLEPGGERKLKAELFPSQVGDLNLRPHASYATAIGLRASVARPPFSLSVTGPELASVGDRVVFALQLGNHTSDPLRRVQVSCKLSPGLLHEQGDHIEADLPNGLAVGEIRTLHMQAETRATGRLSIGVTAMADGRLTAASQHFVAVNEPALTVMVDGARTGTLGHDIAFRVELANPGKVVANNVKLRLALPQGLSFVTASSQGEHDGNTQSINWRLSELQGGQRHSVTFQVKAAQAGDWAMPATLSADAMQEVRATHAVRVDAAPSLALEALAEDDPLDVGRETTYEVRVFNQGTTPASALSVTFYLPEELAGVAQDGPTRGSGQGRLITFEPMTELKSRAAAVYKVKVRGYRPGQGRVRIEANANGLAAPVQRELTCRVRGNGQTQ